jgi:hypothetical protein
MVCGSLQGLDLSTAFCFRYGTQATRRLTCRTNTEYFVIESKWLKDPTQPSRW